jgi:hypothetical protein
MTREQIVEILKQNFASDPRDEYGMFDNEYETVADEILALEQKESKSVDWLKAKFKTVELGEDADGNPYFLGQDSNPELQRCIDIAIEYAQQPQKVEQEEEKPTEYIPYFGWCDVDKCENEGCCGGTGWRETGYWTLCTNHSRMAREGKKQPKMKRSAKSKT